MRSCGFQGNQLASISLSVSTVTAMVYPTLLAAVGDVAHPAWRGRAVGIYRVWRDLGYAVGALLAGVLSDLFGMGTAIGAVAALTFAIGVASAGNALGIEAPDPRQHGAVAERVTELGVTADAPMAGASGEVVSASAATAVATFGKRYVFGTIDQKQLTLQTRVNWILNPNVSLQVYMQPLLAAGDYSDFKELAEKRLRSVEFTTRRAVKIRGLSGRTTIYSARFAED